MAVQKRPFDTLADGRPVTAYSLGIPGGLKAEWIDFGATLTRLEAPDREGRYKDVVLGCDVVGDYLNSPHFGGTVGRFANRIRHGHFVLDGVEYQLPVGNDGHHLHGGERGFDRALWAADEENAAENSLLFRYVSVDGEEGYPGTMEATVLYTLTENALSIHYTASTDAATIVNLTNHSYFNLKGHDGGKIDDHWLKIYADACTPTDRAMIPTGEILPVAGTAYDFREGKNAGGDYDINYVLNQEEGMKLAAEVYEKGSGRHMAVYTDQPGVQLYTSGALHDAAGKGGLRYQRGEALCLETQHYPDSPNHPEWPSVILRPGEVYRSHTRYQFDVR